MLERLHLGHILTVIAIQSMRCYFPRIPSSVCVTIMRCHGNAQLQGIVGGLSVTGDMSTRLPLAIKYSREERRKNLGVIEGPYVMNKSKTKMGRGIRFRLIFYTRPFFF